MYKIRQTFFSVIIGFTLFNAFAKDVIRVTGSASVYPVVSYIYENSPKEVKQHFKANPVIESVGTGAGFEAFCKQTFSSNSPDVVNASREITQTEIANCSKNKITQISKITLGLDGIVLAYSSKSKIFNDANLEIEDIQKALSKYIVINGEVVENKTTHWSQINDKLPNVKIVIYGPNSNSGTFDFLKEIVAKTCLANTQISSYLTSIGKNVKNECHTFRSNIYIEMPDQDSTIARKIELQGFAIGVLRFAFYESSGKYEAFTINGVEPEEEEITTGNYKLARPLFVYFDKSHIEKVQGLKEFLTQIAKFSYRDLITEKNEYNNPQSSSVVVQNKGNKTECEANKKIIGFEFNC